MIRTNQDFEFEKNGFVLETLVISYIMSLLPFHLENDVLQRNRLKLSINFNPCVSSIPPLGQHIFIE